jgi:hypothetical protein
MTDDRPLRTLGCIDSEGSDEETTMDFLGVGMTPNLLEESWRELERERELERTIRARRRARQAAQRAARPARSVSVVARLRRVVRPAAPCPEPAGC